MRLSLKRLGALVPATLLFAFVSSCSDGTLSVSDALSLLNARERWAAKGPDFYSYELQQSCFCPSYGWVRIEVRDNAVVSARVVATDEELDPALWPNIEQLFDRIAQAQANTDIIAKVDLRFDRQYGYPTLAVFTTKPDIADGGGMYEARALEPTSR